MVKTTPTNFFLEHRSAPVRALSSLTRRDADAVRATVRAAGAAHALEEHDDYDGYLSILLTAPAGAASYVVAGRTDSVELSELRGDEMTTIGIFASTGAAMLVLRGLLERGGWSDAVRETPIGRTVAEITSLAAEMIERHGRDADIHAALRAETDSGWQRILRAIDVVKKLPPRS